MGSKGRDIKTGMETDGKNTIAFWRQLREKVKSFDKLDDANLVFGARTRGPGHNYALLPRVTDQEILSFEKNNGFELPPEYRIYLQNFGAGGAGPYYGVADFRTAVLPHVFAEPFPYTEETWYDEVADDDPLWDPPGLAYLIECGCGSGYYIELNGATPGQLWCTWTEALSNWNSLLGLYQAWEDKVGNGLERYHLLKSFIDENNKIPKLTLADVADKLQCEPRLEKLSSNAEGETWVYFEKTPGRILINDKEQVLRIDTGGQIA